MDQSFDVDAILANMRSQLKQLCEQRALQDPLMIGIQTGGVWVAERLLDDLPIPGELGTLNISFYRDDFTRIGVHPRVTPSQLPFQVEGRDIILVDDVLYTGRTIRAALNEIFDYGRPRCVVLAVLADRSGRELPIQADVVGQHIELQAGQQVKLTGPAPLALNVI